MNPFSLGTSLNINKIVFFTQTSFENNSQKDLIMYYNENNESMSLQNIKTEFYSQIINGMNILPATGFQLSEHLNIKKESLPFKDCNVNWIGPFTLKSENFICLDFAKTNFFGICSDLDSLTPFYFIPIQSGQARMPNEFAICTGDYCLRQSRNLNFFEQRQIEVVKVTDINRFESEQGFVFKIWDHSSLFHYLNRKRGRQNCNMSVSSNLNMERFDRSTNNSFRNCLNGSLMERMQANSTNNLTNEIKTEEVINRDTRKNELPVREVSNEYVNLSNVDINKSLENTSLEARQMEETLINKMNEILKSNYSLSSNKALNESTFNSYNSLQDTRLQSPYHFNTPPQEIPQINNIQFDPTTIPTDKIQPNHEMSNPNIMSYINSLENKIQQQEVDIHNLEVTKQQPVCCNSNSTNILNITPPLVANDFVNIPHTPPYPVLNTHYSIPNETIIAPIPTYMKYLNILGNKTLPIDDYDNVVNSVPILIPHSKFMEHPKILTSGPKFINDFYDRIPDKQILFGHRPVHITEIIDDNRYMF